jgi:hypothetical protein
MHANPNMDLDNQYDSLTEKQKAVIDAYAKNPNETNREIARIAGEEILADDGPVNESYCSEILNRDHPQLAEYRAEIEQNEREAGSMQTAGDPFEALQNDQQDTFQTIQDRPVKQTESEEESPQVAETTHTVSPIQVASAPDGIVIKISYSYVEALLKARDVDLPEDMHEQLVDALMQRLKTER